MKTKSTVESEGISFCNLKIKVTGPYLKGRISVNVPRALFYRESDMAVIRKE